ncbi:MAG: hypothetical protein CVU09_04780 [Bacteroidetes bacterium HGW-Bacteroidetes-4]|jgi:hypothetical protein|nr:MAG: hypothetical protein CVU09_04780 [Bacteroidetes bacterium HGW-Bacteroidetes-4]
MASTSESGHAKNVATFEELISSVTAYGSSYNPSKTALTLAALQTVYTNAKTASSALISAITANKNAAGAREAAFKPLSKLITRIFNALKATDAPKKTIENAQSLVRKLQGKRASAKLTDDEKQALINQGIDTKEISTSQMSFDNRIENFDSLIALLASTTEYAPNETDLQVESLSTLSTELKALNSAAINTATQYNNALIARNQILYAPDNGLFDVARDTKAYVKSVFGASSPKYKQIAKLSFKNYKL